MKDNGTQTVARHTGQRGKERREPLQSLHPQNLVIRGWGKGKVILEEETVFCFFFVHGAGRGMPPSAGVTTGGKCVLGLCRSGSGMQQVVAKLSPELRRNVRERAKVWELATGRIKTAELDGVTQRGRAEQCRKWLRENKFRNIST